MASLISELEAKRRIHKEFSPDRDPLGIAHDLPESYYLETLDGLRGQIPFPQEKHNQSLCRFLFAGCVRFDRWFPPSPYVLAPEQHAHFRRFVAALMKAERGASDNTLVFQLHELRDALYAEFDEVPLPQIPRERIAYYRIALGRLRTPEDDVKRLEFESEKSVVVALLEGLDTASLASVFQTRLPYVLHLSPLELSSRWRGVDVKAFVTPAFAQTGETMVNAQPAVVSVGPSRWQGGSSDIRLEFRALVDPDASTPELQTLPGRALPIRGWPKCFTRSFELSHELAWAIRASLGGEQQWVPAPRDLGDVESFVSTSSDPRISFKRRASPANLMHVFGPSATPVHRELGDLASVPWSEKCRVLTTMYLGLGETNEALFWLNVATERLLRERFHTVADTVSRPELERELDSPKAFWAPAEEIVSSQFPEMAGRIHWPETPVHVSVFAKLKYLYKQASMLTSVDETLSHYRAISRHRNALFHGVSDVRIPIEMVTRALESFEWLRANVRLIGGATP